MNEADSDWRDASKERRGFQRVSARVDAALLSTALGRVAATVTDLSQAGCRLRTRARGWRGDHLVLAIGDLAPRAVTVVWAGEGELGVVFAQPLHWTVMTDLAGIER
ncbi:PilZ domain-containing protein [Sphingomonas bacterium]|uniref:PilZ domain-containing protein n=1 Tax=Sphingomonas bacterium TaxID=1895847 RepID=UPI001577417B|nr:PilZ domain-containing protein [Sphingomonas bacterium]